MLQRELMREQVMRLSEQILVNMEEPIIERGYAYFSDGLVFNIQVEKGRRLTSDVQGSQVYRVVLILDNFLNSTCSCPYSRFCKHIAATFFQVYSVFENPRNFLAKVKQPRSATFSPSLLYPAYKKPTKDTRPSTFMHATGVALTEKSSVNEWWSFLESWTRNLTSAMETYRASSELLSSYQSVTAVADTWSEELGDLFTIHSCLFHLLKLQTFVDKHRSSYWSEELNQTAARLLEHLEGTLLYLNASEVRKHHRPHLEATLDIVKDLKHSESSPMHGLFAYRMLWWYLLDEAEWIQAEATELEQLIHDPGLPASARERYQLLQPHFFVMEEKDEAALQIWRRREHLSLPFYLMYVKAFARRSEWQRVLAWIDWLEGLIGSADEPDYRLATAIWQQAMERTGRADECGAMLRRFLPRSFHAYAAYLFEQKQYKQWLDLQMSYKVSPADVNQLQAKAIEEIDPVLLLPFYVRQIDGLIHERNRASYKEAVRLLKKARSCYQKANREDRWEQFIHQLAVSYNRLRAFQEELRRGNLIT
ncbi:SWIM zinc finger family protein [Brevibacillus sp. H7]|uniref:SWIM zinc finger family protein n=1 Tax=Brevibacillus sp. H7 TaxID=3349138 RepID=UPI00380EF37E